MLPFFVAATVAVTTKYCTLLSTGRTCTLCTASAAPPARADAVYTVSGSCTPGAADGDGDVVLPNGVYHMAPGQVIQAPATSNVRIVGQLVVQHPNNAIRGVTTTSHVSVTGRDCSGLEISDVTVTDDPIAVLVAGPRDGLGSINAKGAVISNVVATQNESAAVAVVNAVNGPTVRCSGTGASTLVVRDDPKPQPREQVPSPCELLSLSNVFQIYGSKMELKILGEEPPAWLGGLQWYNWYATQAALLALVAFVTVKAPKV